MSASARILLAEDDPDIRQLIRTRLTMSGYDVQVARNGVEALDRLYSGRPNAMILDINMPELDGFEVLETIKARRIEIAVLVLTARHAADDVQRALRLGAKDYLAKPFTEAQLQVRVARLMRGYSPERKTSCR